MPWVRLDDQFPQHPKVLAVGPLGMAMQVAGLCYCNRYLTDGYIPIAAVPSLLDLNLHGGDYIPIVTKLVDKGLWKPAKDGYKIHNYFLYQMSKKDVLKEREKARVRKSHSRKSHAAVTDMSRRDTGGSHGGSHTTPNPIPIPSQSPEIKTPPGSPESAAKSPPRVTAGNSPEFVERMTSKWGVALGAESIPDRIREALGHQAALKRHDKDAYVNRWLRKDATDESHKGQRNGNGQHGAAGSNGSGAGPANRPNWEHIAAEREGSGAAV